MCYNYAIFCRYCPLDWLSGASSLISVSPQCSWTPRARKSSLGFMGFLRRFGGFRCFLSGFLFGVYGFFLVRVQGFSAFWAWGFGIIMVTLRSRCLDPYPKDKGHD